MEKIQLQLFLQIIGIGAASGILYKDNSLFIIGDNSGYLYEYPLDSKQLKKYPLIENPSENIAKNSKPDFEAIANYGDNVYIFGSGSTENRNTMVEVDLKTKTAISTTDLSDLYLTMQSFGQIKPTDFNIEGAVYTGENWYLFNRGNGISEKNTVFTVNSKNLKYEFSILSNDYSLPKINGIPSSFTDAIIVGTKMYFLATAEDSKSTYDDGKVHGSLIGRIDLEEMEIEFMKEISSTHKFEGLTLYKNSKDKIEFLLCEDKDSDVLQSDIYLLSIEKL